MNLTPASLGFGARSGNAGIVSMGFGTTPVLAFGNLTPASFGFGHRIGTAGVVTEGFGTSGIAPTPATGSRGGAFDPKLYKKKRRLYTLPNGQRVAASQREINEIMLQMVAGEPPAFVEAVKRELKASFKAPPVYDDVVLKIPPTKEAVAEIAPFELPPADFALAVRHYIAMVKRQKDEEEWILLQ